jgi:hypothetical protein
LQRKGISKRELEEEREGESSKKVAKPRGMLLELRKGLDTVESLSVEASELGLFLQNLV